jgi:hypothetical protein
MVVSVNFVSLVLSTNVAGLDAKHDGDTDEGDEEEDLRDCLLCVFLEDVDIL